MAPHELLDEPIEYETTLGAFRPGTLGGNIHLFEASQGLYRLYHVAEVNTEKAKHGCQKCQESTHGTAYRLELRQLQEALRANHVLIHQLSQAHAKAAYYEELCTRTANARQRHGMERCASEGRNRGKSASSHEHSRRGARSDWSTTSKLMVLAEASLFGGKG